MRIKVCALAVLMVATACGSSMTVSYTPDGTAEVLGGEPPYTFRVKEGSTVQVHPETGTMVRVGEKSTEVVLGLRHTCAIDAEAALWCWGHNRYGQTGSSPVAMQLKPVRTGTVPRKYKSVGLTNNGTCAVTTGNELYCWGYVNTWHTVELEESPPGERLVSGLPGTIKQLAGGFDHMCALLDEGDVYCWGSNVFATVTGILSDVREYPNPVRVEGVAGARTIAAGQYRNCAAGEALYCWGWDLSLGSFYSKVTTLQEARAASETWSDLVYADPEVATDALRDALREYATLRVTALPDGADGIVIGGLFTCVFSEGRAWCKGVNSFETSPAAVYSTELLQVGKQFEFERITGGGGVLCYEGAATLCVGDLKHLVPEETSTNGTTPYRFGDVKWNVLRVSSWLIVKSRACGIDDKGVLYCWGSNEDTVAGDGGKGVNPLPVHVNLSDPINLNNETYSITVTDAAGRRVVVESD